MEKVKLHFSSWRYIYENFKCYISNKNVMFEIHLLAIKFDIVISDMRGHGYKISIKIIKKEIKF